MNEATQVLLDEIAARRESTWENTEALQRGRFLDEEYRPSTWDDTFNVPIRNGKDRTAAQVVLSWVLALPTLLVSHKPVLLLYGACGTGKTYLARMAGVLATIAYDYQTPLFVNWSVTLARARGAGGKLDVNPILDAGFLVLDDMGAERPTEWATEQLYAVVEGRTQPTVITMNLAPRVWLDAALAGRIRDTDNDTFVKQQLIRIHDRLCDGDGGKAGAIIELKAAKSRRQI